MQFCFSTFLTQSILSLRLLLFNNSYFPDEQKNSTNNIPIAPSNSTNIFCDCEEFWMQQALLVVSLAHCFITLVTTGVECQKCIKTQTKPNQTPEQTDDKTEEQTKNVDCEKNPRSIRTLFKNEFTIIFLQWVVPIITIIFLCLSVDTFKTFKETDEKTDTGDFQNLITDVMENPINISTHLKYKEDVDNIVNRVYSIIEEVANNQSVEYRGPKPQDLYNIIEMLEVRTREPKMAPANDSPPNDTKFKFKLYTFFFTVFDYLLPLIYSNIMYVKSKMCVKMNENKVLHKRGVNELSVNMKYLRNSIIFATVLWTPSFIEFLSRTFLTNDEPNTITQALMATGNSYMLLRYGINVKTIKNMINQSNYVLPLK